MNQMNSLTNTQLKDIHTRITKEFNRPRVSEVNKCSSTRTVWFGDCPFCQLKKIRRCAERAGKVVTLRPAPTLRNPHAVSVYVHPKTVKNPQGSKYFKAWIYDVRKTLGSCSEDNKCARWRFKEILE